MAKRKIMREFKINELSAVDRPAQEGAQMVLMKRDLDDKKKKPKKGEPGYVAKLALLTEDHADGHSHLILGPGDIAGFTSGGGTSHDDWHSHPWIKMENGTVVVGALNGHAHTILEGTFKMLATTEHLEELFSEDVKTSRKAVAERAVQTADGIAMKNGSLPIVTAEDVATVLDCQEFWGDNPDAIRHIMKRATVLEVELPNEGELATLFNQAQLASEDDLSKENKTMTTKNDKVTDEGSADATKLEEAVAKQAATEAELAVAKHLAEMTDAQKDHYTGLELEAATEFLTKSSDEKDAEITEASEADKVVYKSVDGTEYRKSDDTRLVAMAKDRDTDAKKLAKLEKDAEDKSYAKRAKDELANLPGTEDSKIATLKALDGIEDEDVRNTALESLHASNADMAQAFAERGTGSSPASVSAEAELDTLAKKYADENEVDFNAAMTHVCRTPEGSALYDQITQH